MKKYWFIITGVSILFTSSLFAQNTGYLNIYQNIYDTFSKSFVSDGTTQYNQVIDDLTKLLNNQDIPSEIKAKAGVLLSLSYIFQDNISAAHREIVKALPLMEKSVPQTQDALVFSKVKSIIEKSQVKNCSEMVLLPEFNASSIDMAKKLTFLIEGRENYKKSVQQCAQKYKLIFKETFDNLVKENKIPPDAAESLRKKIEPKYMSKIEKDGYFLISDLKQEFSQYLFETLFSN
jgi:hypothetical protein